MSKNKHHKRKVYRNKSNKKKRLLLALVLLVIITSFGVYIMLHKNSTPEPTKVLLTTTMGNILIELRNDMPITTENFITLSQQGIYDNTIFHRVIPNFMIQGGDPTGTGMGDPSIPNISDEFSANNHNNRGTIAMANAGPNTGSSQFFINVVNNNYLDTAHPVFGKVIEGMDVADSISLVAVNDTKPVKDVIILKAEIQKD